MVPVADPEESAKRHDRVGDFPRKLIDHHVVDRTKFLSSWVVNVCALHLAGRNQVSCFLDGFHHNSPGYSRLRGKIQLAMRRVVPKNGLGKYPSAVPSRDVCLERYPD